MIITNPQLPPKEGYVEDEIDGVRQYVKIQTEQDTINAALMLEIAKLKAGVSA